MADQIGSARNVVDLSVVLSDRLPCLVARARGRE
jgi:hypothetical protein